MKSKTHPKQLLEALSRGGEINYEAFGFGNEYDPQWEDNQHSIFPPVFPGLFPTE